MTQYQKLILFMLVRMMYVAYWIAKGFAFDRKTRQACFDTALNHIRQAADSSDAAFEN